MQKVSDESIIEALQANNGLIKKAAEQLGITRDTIYKRLRNNDEVKQILVNSRDDIADVAESKLIAAMERDEPWAIMCILKAVAKSRGYGNEASFNIQTTVKAEVEEPRGSFDNFTKDEMEIFSMLYDKYNGTDGGSYELPGTGGIRSNDIMGRIRLLIERGSLNG